MISRWNKTNPSIDRIIDIADYFHISIDKVLGRNKNHTNDDFLDALYEKTSEMEISWKSFDNETDMSGLKQFSYDLCYDYDDFSSPEDYTDYLESNKQISYYFEHNHGYISIYALYEYHQINKPKELKLFIQPSNDAELIQQTYEYNEILPLWILVLSSLDDNAPDEIKAENLKNDFIRKSKKHKLKLKINNSSKIDDK